MSENLHTDDAENTPEADDEVERPYADAEGEPLRCPEHGFERISAASASSVDWIRRRRLEHHRENIIEAVIDMADELDLYVGEPTADIDLLTHDEFDVFE